MNACQIGKVTVALLMALQQSGGLQVKHQELVAFNTASQFAISTAEPDGFKGAADWSPAVSFFALMQKAYP